MMSNLESLTSNLDLDPHSPITISIRTTHADNALRQKLEWFLQQPGIDWLVENSKSGGVYPKLTITRRGVFLNDGLENLHFHPSMALLRLMNRFRGHSDRYLLATGLIPGDTLLDLTMGLGTDALVGAWAVGKQGRVTGVECSPVLSALVNDGLQSLFTASMPKSENAAKQLAWEALSLVAGRIKVICADHLDFLGQQPSASVEVIYFDPMFRYPSQKSASIKPLHSWSDHQSLRLEVIREARRVARRCIVLKERKGSSEFTRLGFDILSGGKYSQVDYGLIRCSMFDGRCSNAE
ncbi:MAG: class I SAM-dependent methyltransferase [Desulfitobacteriaceae bacterium]